MARRAGLLAILPALLPERGPPAQLGADLPRGPLGHRLARSAGLVDQEPVAELGVVAVGVEQRVRAIGRGQLGVGDRTGAGRRGPRGLLTIARVVAEDDHQHDTDHGHDGQETA